MGGFICNKRPKSKSQALPHSINRPNSVVFKAHINDAVINNQKNDNEDEHECEFTIKLIYLNETSENDRQMIYTTKTISNDLLITNLPHKFSKTVGIISHDLIFFNEQTSLDSQKKLSFYFSPSIDNPDNNKNLYCTSKEKKLIIIDYSYNKKKQSQKQIVKMSDSIKIYKAIFEKFIITDKKISIDLYQNQIPLEDHKMWRDYEINNLSTINMSITTDEIDEKFTVPQNHEVNENKEREEPISPNEIKLNVNDYDGKETKMKEFHSPSGKNNFISQINDNFIDSNLLVSKINENIADVPHKKKEESQLYLSAIQNSQQINPNEYEEEKNKCDEIQAQIKLIIVKIVFFKADRDKSIFEVESNCVEGIESLKQRLHVKIQNKYQINKILLFSDIVFMYKRKIVQNNGKLCDIIQEDEVNDIEFQAYYEIEVLINFFNNDKNVSKPFMLTHFTKLKDLKQMEEFFDIDIEDHDFVIGEKIIREESLIIGLLPERKSFIRVIKKPLQYEFFGFNQSHSHENLIGANYFQSFFLDNQKGLIDHLKFIDFENKEHEPIFQKRILNPIFSILKKHSIWEGRIRQISERIFDTKKVILWADESGNPSKYFNTQFLLHYIINFSTPTLKMLVSNAIQENYPIPLFTRNWKSNFKSTDIRMNNELYWINHKGFTLGSCGVGIANQKSFGKSSLLNKIFFTNFNENFERHPICSETAEIAIDIYKNLKYKVDLIDIQAKNEEDIIYKILTSCNLQIFHIFESEKEQCYEEIQKKYGKSPKLIFLHGKKNVFKDIKQFETDISLNFENSRKNFFFEIKIDNNASLEHNLFRTISEYVHRYIHENYTLQNNNEIHPKWKFFSYFGLNNEKLESLLNNLDKNSDKIIINYNHFKTLLEENKNINEWQVKKNSSNYTLGRELTDLLELLFDDNDKAIFLWEKLRGFLRNIKSEKTKEFYKLYEIRSSFEKKTTNMDLEIKKEEEIFIEIYGKILKKSTIFEKPELSILMKEKNYENLIKKILFLFESQYLPQILSFELIWREIISTLILLSKYNSGKYYEELEQKFLTLAKNYILNGYPFEIIDGDLLYLPKDFLAKVLKNVKDEVCIISVFGPQSSGKSTLLNFLFGCDFFTSTGRCTKGIYGSYYKLSNFNAYKGMLILDTEGLFSTSVEATAETNILRKNFDNKLVLFCLSVSDIVIINSKGDPDKAMKEVLTVCLNSLVRLRNGNMKFADMFLVLNQNPINTLDTHMRDLSNMFDDLIKYWNLDPENKFCLSFNRENVKILTNAFDVQNFDKKNYSYLSFLSDDIVKRKPTTKFYDDCCDFCKKIFETLQDIAGKNKKKQTLEDAFTEMEKMWHLINSCDILTVDKNLFEKEFKEKVNEYISNNLLINFNENVKLLKNKILNSDNIEHLIELGKNNVNQLENLKENLLTDLNKKFEKEASGFQNLYQKLVEGFENQMNEAITTHRMHFFHKTAQKTLKNLIMDGGIIIEEAAKEVKRKKITQKSEQENTFEKAWKNLRSEIVKKIDEFNLKNKDFNQVYELYTNSNLLDFTRTDMLNPDYWPLFEVENLEFQGYSKFLKEKKLAKFFSHKNKRDLFEYSKNSLALILKNGVKTDVKKRYFDITKYFKKGQKKKHVCLEINEIFKLLSKDDLIDDIVNNPSFIEEIEEHLQLILKHLNNYLFNYGKSFTYTGFLHIFRKIKFESAAKIYQKVSSIVNQFSEEQLSSCFSDKGKKSENFNKQYHFIVQFQYSNKNEEYFSRRYFLRILIDWNSVIESFYEKVQKIQNFKFLKDFEADLMKLGLAFPSDKERKKFLINLLQRNDLTEVKLKKSKEICDYQFNFQNITNIRLKYFSTEDISNNLVYDIEETVAKPENFISFGFRMSEIFEIIKEAQKIQYLDDYKNENFGGLYKNTFEDKDLLREVENKFNLELLFDDIYNEVKKEIEKYNDIDPLMIKTINTSVYDIITTANLDLQQVSYSLSFSFKAHLHYFVIHIIWKYFQEKKKDIFKKIVDDFDQQKEKQKNFFFATISKNYKEKTEKEIDKIKILFTSLCEKEKEISKDKKASKKSASYKKKYTRLEVIKQTDEQIFNAQDRNLGEKAMLDYIKDPQKFIRQTYDDIFNKLFFNELRGEMEKKKIKIIEEIKVVISIFKMVEIKFLRVQNLTEENSFFKDCFELDYSSNDAASEVVIETYEDELAKFFAEYIFQIILGVKASTAFNTKDKKLTARMKNKFLFSDPNLFKLEKSECKFFYKFFELVSSKKECKIYNLVIFNNMILSNLNSFSSLLDSFSNIDTKDIQPYKASIIGDLCNSKCPFCDRMCGLCEPHKIHKCVYGHQIRAFGGIKLSNGEASVAFCEDIPDNNNIEFDGRKLTWFEMKKYVKNKANPWDLDDDFLNEKSYAKDNRFRIKNVWNFIGQELCKGNSMNYVQYQEVNLENQFYQPPDLIHYILAIDSSGSMYGKKWESLKDSLQFAFQEISKENKDNIVTIVNFSSKSIIEYEKSNPSTIPLETIQFQGSGTDFKKAFSTIYSVLQKENGQCGVRCIFMSDGESLNPSEEIDQIKNYLENTPQLKFEFYAIMFDFSSKVIDEICQNIGGKSCKPMSLSLNSSNQLKTAFYEIISKKI